MTDEKDGKGGYRSGRIGHIRGQKGENMEWQVEEEEGVVEG